jgi:murein DD-endopeptidase MepM/ murein hydrolase activator NlpD
MQERQTPITDEDKYFSIRKKNVFIVLALGLIIIIFFLRYLFLHGLYIGFTPPPDPPEPLSQELVSRFNQIEDQLNRAINDVNEVYLLKEKLNTQLPKKDVKNNKDGKGGRYLPLQTLNLAEKNYDIPSSFNQIQTTLDEMMAELPFLKNGMLDLIYLQSNLPDGIPLIGEYKISSGFGERPDPFTLRPSFHPGIDIASDIGTPVLAAADGKVLKTSRNKNDSNYGIYVEIAHPNQVTTLYGHLSEILVQENQSIRKGDIIGLVGETGRTTGPHLHFEVQVSGTAIDPMSFMSPIKVKPNPLAISSINSEIKVKCAPLLLIVKDENSKIFKDCLANKGNNVKNDLLAFQGDNTSKRPESTSLQEGCTYVDENKRLQTKNNTDCASKQDKN